MRPQNPSKLPVGITFSEWLEVVALQQDQPQWAFGQEINRHLPYWRIVDKDGTERLGCRVYNYHQMDAALDDLAFNLGVSVNWLDDCNGTGRQSIHPWYDADTERIVREMFAGDYEALGDTGKDAPLFWEKGFELCKQD